MCEMCQAKTESYLSPIPGWTLVRATVDGDMMKAGEWGLVRSNDPEFIWSTSPWSEPPENSNKDREDAWFDDAIKFNDELVSNPEVGYNIVSASLKVGFNPVEQRFGFWLFGFLGQWVENHKPIPNTWEGSYALKLIESGYIEADTTVRATGKIYSLVSPKVGAGNGNKEYIESVSEGADGTEISSYDLEPGTNVLLVSSEKDWCTILVDQKTYRVNPIYLSKDQVSEVGNDRSS